MSRSRKRCWHGPAKAGHHICPRIPSSPWASGTCSDRFRSRTCWLAAIAVSICAWPAAATSAPRICCGTPRRKSASARWRSTSARGSPACWSRGRSIPARQVLRSRASLRCSATSIRCGWGCAAERAWRPRAACFRFSRRRPRPSRRSSFSRSSGGRDTSRSGSVAGSVILAPLAYMYGAPEVTVIAAIIVAAIVVHRHRSNLRRVFAGIERRLGQSA